MQLTYYNVWNDKNYQKFLDELVTLCDSKYLAFNKSIVFTKYKMLGIRVPIMRSLAKDISKTDFIIFKLQF